MFRVNVVKARPDLSVHCGEGLLYLIILGVLHGTVWWREDAQCGDNQRGRGGGGHTQWPPAIVTRGHYSLADVVLLLLLLLLLSHHLPPRAGLDWVWAGGGEAGTLYILAPGGGTRPPPASAAATSPGPVDTRAPVPAQSAASRHLPKEVTHRSSHH